MMQTGLVWDLYRVIVLRDFQRQKKRQAGACSTRLPFDCESMLPTLLNSTWLSKGVVHLLVLRAQI